MSFTNLIFLFVFFPVSILTYYIVQVLAKRFGKEVMWPGNVILVLLSLCFFAWSRVEDAMYFFIYMVLVYFLGWLVKRGGEKQRGEKLALSLGLVILAAILIYYKYFNFLAENAALMLGRDFEARNILVPAGISFITFSAISYLVDIYRKSCDRGSLLDTMLYLSFFPKVISGPIVLWKDFQPQIKKRTVNDACFLQGLNRMMIGFSKKVILADTFGKMIQDIQEQIGIKGISCPTSWLCALLYMFQIYYDFAGYSDIAIGISNLFGFQIKENFNFPYVSKSITEFWRRWHISLGTWFREYIYIPLGGNRKGQVRTLVNLGIVFLVTGIWHGAGWNYIWWGGINAFFVILERCIRNTAFYKKIPGFLKWAFTMTVVFFSWQLFRFPKMEDFWAFWDIMFGVKAYERVPYRFTWFLSTKLTVYLVIAGLGATVLCHPFFGKLKQRLAEKRWGLILQETVLLLLMIFAVLTMVNSSYSPFIYFQY